MASVAPEIAKDGLDMTTGTSASSAPNLALLRNDSADYGDPIQSMNSNVSNSGFNGSSKNTPSRKSTIVKSIGAESYEHTRKEAIYISSGQSIEERDDDALRNLGDQLHYFIENGLAAYPGSQLYALGVVFLAFLVLFTLIFYGYVKSCQNSNSCTEDFGETFNYDFNIGDCFYFILQVLAVGGFEMESRREGYRIIFFLTIFVGLIVWAILVGFITEMVQSFMADLNKGKSKVVERGHTLILGWNEATVRAITQIAYLRIQWNELNSAPLFSTPFLSMFMTKGTFKSTTIPPSTRVASSTVVLLCDKLEKEEMQDRIRDGLAERGVSHSAFQIGSDVICRLGDPTNVHDLVKVGVIYASAVLCMMTEYDEEEFQSSGGKIENGATIRTLLAIRHILFTSNDVLHMDTSSKIQALPEEGQAEGDGDFANSTGGLNAGLRIVVQLSAPCPFIEAACFKNSKGENTVFPVDLNLFMSSLLFACAGQKGLEAVLMDLFNFDGVAIRRRPASTLRGGENGTVGGMVGLTFAEASKWVHNSCLIGVVDLKKLDENRNFDNKKLDNNNPQNSDGLAPHYDREIKHSDLIIFLDDNSIPEHDENKVEKEKKAQAEYDENKDEVKKEEKPESPKENTLICGWREEWSDNYIPLKKIIEETAQDCAEGSRLTFLNGLESHHFKSLMDECQYKVKVGEEPNVYEWKGKEIEHVCGDAAAVSDLQPVIDKLPYHVGIIMGTQAKGSLNAHSRDTRVMGMLLLLRQLINIKRKENPGNPEKVPHMHIIGENQEDLTSLLALTPKAMENKQLKSDFVNTQAIAARVLIQTLAYPTISHAVGAFFDETPGKPNLNFVPVGGCCPLKKTICYSTVKLFVEKHFEGKAFVICIGVAIAPRNEGSYSSKLNTAEREGGGKKVSSDSFKILPQDDAKYTFQDGDRIICIKRDIVKKLLRK